MLKSDIIAAIAAGYDNMTTQQVKLGVKEILTCLAGALVNDQRIEIRGFGCIMLHHYEKRTVRNPKTGESLVVKPASRACFKAGKALKERVNKTKSET